MLRHRRRRVCIINEEDAKLMTYHTMERALALVLITLTGAFALTGLLAAAAFADSGGMEGMPGMTEEEMQNMTPPSSETEAASDHSAASASDGRDSDASAAPHMDMSSAVNWLVIGGFVALVLLSTFLAAATKRRLRRRMLTGELASAGALNV